MSEKPYEISGTALRVLSNLFRRWSGRPLSAVRFGDTDETVSSVAHFDTATQEVVINPSRVILNPNRVLRSITSFRLRQEAVLTGTLIHEAGHARFSRWLPEDEKALKSWRHLDGRGDPVSMPVLEFARILEEPRVESRARGVAGAYQFDHLTWTLDAARAHLLPRPEITGDPDQQVMDVAVTYVLHVGRELARRQQGIDAGKDVGRWPGWVDAMEALLIEALDNSGKSDPQGSVNKFAHTLMDLITSGANADESTVVVDTARDMLTLLFDTPPDKAPTPSQSSQCSQDQGQEGQGSPETGEQDSEEGQGQGEAGEPGEDSEGGEEGDSGDSGDSDSEGAGDSDEYDPLKDLLDDGSGADDADKAKQIQAAIDAAVEEANKHAEQTAQDEAREAAKEAATSDGSLGVAGHGAEGLGADRDKWRKPRPLDRDVQRGAEKFLRDLINPSTVSSQHLTESPSATVDPAELAAWKAGGQKRDPRFFRRTRRDSRSAPPVKIAILVDVSSSMEVLQAPSAQLSWALANAAVDLRNFAGRGAQIQSTTITWGTRVDVVQKPGEYMPGISSQRCDQYTSAMHTALDEVEVQIPGFFSPSEEPENRLLVQFTDWGVSQHCLTETIPRVHRALANGVNMLSVVPTRYAVNNSRLAAVMRNAPTTGGRSYILSYDASNPSGVWDAASMVLSH